MSNVCTEPFSVKVPQCFFTAVGSLLRIHVITGAKGRMRNLQIGGMNDVADKITLAHLKNSMSRSVSGNLDCLQIRIISFNWFAYIAVVCKKTTTRNSLQNINNFSLFMGC